MSGIDNQRILIKLEEIRIALNDDEDITMAKDLLDELIEDIGK